LTDDGRKRLAAARIDHNQVIVEQLGVRLSEAEVRALESTLAQVMG
jgi:hypothetical protein